MESPTEVHGGSARPSRSALIAFVVVLVVVAIGVMAALSQSAVRLAGTNNVFLRFANVTLEDGVTACERRETVPGGTAAIRLSTQLGGQAGSTLAARVIDRNGRTVSRGSLPSGWRGRYADIPVATVDATLTGAQVCVTSSGAETVKLLGFGSADEAAGVMVDGRALRETIRVAYLRGGEETWWSLLPTVAHRMGIGRGTLLDGAWVGFAWLALIAALLATVTAAVLLSGRNEGSAPAAGGRRALRRVPLAGWLCVVVTGLSGLAWSLATPPMHVPDEVSHLAYSQYLAETGRLPTENGDLDYSPEEQQALTDLDFYMVVGDVSGRPPWTEAQDTAMDVKRPVSPVGSGSAQSATNNPPLYYGLQAIPYRLGKALGLGLLDRMVLMRVLSVLLACVTALASFLFVREVLPGAPWSWTAGGLVVALQPLFGFVSSGIQADAGLFAAAALLLLATARAFHRGLTPQTGAAIGGALAVGFLSKLAFIGMVPGAALAVAVLLVRAPGHQRTPAWRGAALALGILLGVVVAYAIAVTTVWDRSVLSGAGSAVAAPATDGAAARGLNQAERLGYIWQLYLPRLPFMLDQFPGPNPMPNLWLHGLIGQFGWLDVSWPLPVYRWARWVLVLIFVLAFAGLVRSVRRGAFGPRAVELACYGVSAIGLLGIVGAAGYRSRIDGSGAFEQARYVLPLLPLYAAAAVLAARSLGARGGPVFAAALIASAFGHTLFAQLLTISRFFG